MRGSTSLQLSAGLIAALTPLVVVAVVYAVAAAHARTVAVALRWPASARWLLALTPLAAAGTVSVGLMLPPPSLTASAINVLAFVLLAVPAFRALHQIDAASAPARILDQPVREASLTPRRTADFVPWRWRALPYAIVFAGTAAFVARAIAVSARQDIMVPAAMALAAVAFLFLYEVWIRDLVAGPVLASENPTSRRTLIRHVFAAELGLVAVSVASAHALLGVDWTRPGALTVIVTFVSAMIAVLGCGLALASDLVQRRYARSGRAS
jgi:hypothetical protein